MSRLLHYKIMPTGKYGPEKGFKNQEHGIPKILKKYGCKVVIDKSNGKDIIPFHVCKKELRHFVWCMKKRSPRSVVLKCQVESLGTWTVQEVVDFFSAAIKNSRKEDKVINFVWS